MIDYNQRDLCMHMNCDSCSENDTFFGDFQECIDESKLGGWVITKEGEEWVHTCWRCAEDLNKKSPFEEIQ